MASPVLRSLGSPLWARPLERAFALACARPFDRLRVRLTRTLIQAFDPTTTPAAWLPWLSSVVGMPYHPDIPEDRQRALIAVACSVWAGKGRRPEVRDYVRAVAGVTADVVHVDGLAFIAGVSRAGDVCGTVRPLWSYVVRVPVGSVTEDRLREILRPVVPTYCAYTVEYT